MSLRDVERAMLVFTYFFEKMDLLRDKLDEQERKEKEAENRIFVSCMSLHTHLTIL